MHNFRLGHAIGAAKFIRSTLFTKGRRTCCRRCLHKTAAVSSVGGIRSTDAYIGMTGGQIFHDTLADLGVTHVFGYPGGAILPVFDAIYHSDQMQFILSRHEQCAGHMAEAAAEATGKPGVVLVTSGPGATNVVTAMQDALMDSRPLVVFCGQVATGILGTDAFQEADMLGISRPCTKWNTQVRDVHDMARNIREAFHIATTERPGPVLVDLPKDVAASVCTRAVTTQRRLFGVYGHDNSELVVEQTDAFNRAVNLINRAKKPVILAGHGALEAYREVRELAVKRNIPVTTSLQGLGVFDETHPLALHMMGMHGTAYANLAVQEADTLIVVGARFDDRVTGAVAQFAPKVMEAAAAGHGGIIHFDISKKQISKLIPATVSILGDCGENLRQLLPRISTTHVDRKWTEEVQALKTKYPLRYRPAIPNAPMKPQSVIEELYAQTKTRDDVLLTTGVGQHQMWAAQFYRHRRPRTVITSGGLGTMGFGLPAAIGVKLARPDMTVVDIDGDSCLGMTLVEMATAAANNVDIKVLMLNNDFQGMVKQWQDLFYDNKYSGTEMVNPDFCGIARAMKWKAILCDKQEKMKDAVAEMLRTRGPVMAEFVVDKEEHVLPMVSAGKGLSNLITGDLHDCPPTTAK